MKWKFKQYNPILFKYSKRMEIRPIVMKFNSSKIWVTEAKGQLQNQYFFQTDNHNHKQIIDFRTDMRIIVKSKP